MRPKRAQRGKEGVLFSVLDHGTHALIDIGVDGRDEECLLFGTEAVQVDDLHLLGNRALAGFTGTCKKIRRKHEGAKRA